MTFSSGLEFTLSRNEGSLPGTSSSCGVLLCKTPSPGYSDDDERNITSMSLYKAVSQRQTNSERNKPNELRRLATVSSSKPDLERVCNGMRINGSLQNGQATLRVELSESKDCLTNYTCEVEEVDSQGEELVTSSQLLQKQDQIPDNGLDVGLTSALFMKLFSLVEGLDVKVTAAENCLKDKLNYVVDQITNKFLFFENSVQSKLNEKAADLRKEITNKIFLIESSIESKLAIGEKSSERLETKLSSVDAKLNSVETKINSVESELSSVKSELNSVEKKISSVENSCQSEAHNLQNKMTDKIHSLENSLQSKASLAFQKIDDKLVEMKIKLTSMDSEVIQQRVLNAIEYQVNEHFKIISNATEKTEGALIETASRIKFLTSEYTSFQNNTITVYHRLFDDVSRGMDVVFLKNKNLKNIIQNKLYEFQEALKACLGFMASSTKRSVNKTLTSLEFHQSAQAGKIISDLIEFLSPRKCTKYMFPNHTGAYPYYTLYRSDIIGLNTALLVCDTHTDNGGWIVFQKRSTGEVNFYRDWRSYKEGFGTSLTDFWLGLDNIHAITRSGRFELRVDLKYQGQSKFAVYDRFSVAGEDKNYKLTLGSYSGTAGDSLKSHKDPLGYHDGMQFSTYDNDNDKNKGINCAVACKGAWWYNSCAYANLNGKWQAGGSSWFSLTGTDAASFTEMKIRRMED
ncbi:ficolin-2 [Elysia marginata]|uniref:Ficolin-2 n=1 Tax=Elysia marginata TaxID=1093978 RepID=A0AAV4IBQ6_9GAST|nr:ficolin-2 [Elysia marginata]